MVHKVLNIWNVYVSEKVYEYVLILYLTLPHDFYYCIEAMIKQGGNSRLIFCGFPQVLGFC